MKFCLFRQLHACRWYILIILLFPHSFLSTGHLTWTPCTKKVRSKCMFSPWLREDNIIFVACDSDLERNCDIIGNGELNTQGWSRKKVIWLCYIKKEEEELPSESWSMEHEGLKSFLTSVYLSFTSKDGTQCMSVGHPWPPRLSSWNVHGGTESSIMFKCYSN